MGGQHQRVDRPGLLRHTKGSRRQEEVETAGFKVIGGAPTTLRVTGLMTMIERGRTPSTHGFNLFITKPIFSCPRLAPMRKE